jgi:hypothetical protein
MVALPLRGRVVRVARVVRALRVARVVRALRVALAMPPAIKAMLVIPE